MTDDNPEMTPLLSGFQVPAHFTVRLRGRARRTPVTAVAEVEMIDGRPSLRALALGVPDPGSRPMSASDLAAISLTDILDSAVRQAALEHTPMRWEPAGDAPVPLESFIGWADEQWSSHEAAALESARAARNRRRITPDDLSRALSIYASKGIEAVMGEFGYSQERSARRLLARARKELQQ